MPVAIRVASRIQDQDDVNITPGAGTDGYALTWDNGTARFVLSKVAGSSITIAVADSPYTVLNSDGTIRCDCAGGAVSVVLPAAIGSGRVLNVKKIDASANAVTVTPDGAETIDGEATQAIDGQYDNMQLQDAATGAWDII